MQITGKIGLVSKSRVRCMYESRACMNLRQTYGEYACIQTTGILIYVVTKPVVSNDKFHRSFFVGYSYAPFFQTKFNNTVVI